MIRNNRICDILGIKFPIVQGAMSWVTNAEFVAAVSNAGGLGMLGPHAGQTTNPTSNEEVIERMRAEIRKVKTLTDKPFAMPFMISYDMAMIPLMVNLIIEEKVPVVLDNGYLNAEIYQQLKQNGIKIICRLPNPNLEDAKKAEALQADVLVLTGFDEGGTLPKKEIGSFSVLADFVGKTSLPLMLAGGIADAKSVRAALALGAEGVYAGTLFIATQESPVAQSVKDWIVRASAEDLLLFRTEPYYYRSLPTELGKKLFAMSEAGATRSEIAQVMNAGTGMRLGMLEGDFENGYISLGNGISHITEIRPIKEVIEDVMQDFL